MSARITVSLPDDVVVAVNAAVAAGQAASVSAYVAVALREKSGRESLDDLLVELRAELGPPSAEDEAWARDLLGVGE